MKSAIELGFETTVVLGIRRPPRRRLIPTSSNDCSAAVNSDQPFRVSSASMFEYEELLTSFPKIIKSFLLDPFHVDVEILMRLDEVDEWLPSILRRLQIV